MFDPRPKDGFVNESLSAKPAFLVKALDAGNKFVLRHMKDVQKRDCSMKTPLSETFGTSRYC